MERQSGVFCGGHVSAPRSDDAVTVDHAGSAQLPLGSASNLKDQSLYATAGLANPEAIDVVDMPFAGANAQSAECSRSDLGIGWGYEDGAASERAKQVSESEKLMSVHCGGPLSGVAERVTDVLSPSTGKTDRLLFRARGPRWAVCLAAAAACVAASAPYAAAADGAFFTIGPGMSSCATWSHADFEAGPVGGWIAGFWSGLNAMNETAHLVGSHSDYLGIISEVERLCDREPSRAVVGAVLLVYKRLSREGR